MRKELERTAILLASSSSRDSAPLAHLHRHPVARMLKLGAGPRTEAALQDVSLAGETGSPRGPSGSPRGDPEASHSPRAGRPLQPPRTMALALSAACLYGAAAISMNFVNKASLHVYPLPNTLLLLQMVATLLVILPLRALNLVQLPALSSAKAWHLLPVTLLYVSNVAFALVGLQTLNIPMYNTLKRLTPVLVLGAKAYLNRRLPAWDITASVLLIVGGCLVAGMGDFSFDLRGYVCALASVTLQASYLLLVERSGAEKGIGVAELLLYNALLSLPFILAVTVALGELPNVVATAVAAVQDMGAISCSLLLASNSLLGMLLNFALFLCTMHNSALTTTIVGVLKGVVATSLGFFLLGGVAVHGLNLAGIAINTLGGTWYTTIKYRQRRRRQLEQGQPTLIMMSDGKSHASPTPHDVLSKGHEPHRLSHVHVHAEAQPLLSAVPDRMHKHDSANSLQHMTSRS